MRRAGPGCRTADKRWREQSPLAWFAIMVAVTAFLSRAVAAAVSFGGHRLLPSNEPFIPYYTT